MKSLLAIVVVLTVAGCGRSSPQTLADARRHFTTHIDTPYHTGTEVPLMAAEPGLLETVHYPSPTGSLPAYLTTGFTDSAKHPGVLVLAGDDCHQLPEVLGAKAALTGFRSLGLVMLFPALRGGNESTASQEYFYGEVNDVLAAADFLASQPGVDPSRIYLIGDSTGGTLALLTAEYSARFRCVFSIGPADDVSGYPPFPVRTYDTRDPEELRLRNPINWLASIAGPTFVMEGDASGSNIGALRKMAQACPKNVPAHFIELPNLDHLKEMSYLWGLVLPKIANDSGPACNITITAEEAAALSGRRGRLRPPISR